MATTVKANDTDATGSLRIPVIIGTQTPPSDQHHVYEPNGNMSRVTMSAL
jgi:hypothetical protein